MRLPKLESESIDSLRLRPIGVVTTIVATCLSFDDLVKLLVLLTVANALEVRLIAFLVVLVY